MTASEQGLFQPETDTNWELTVTKGILEGKHGRHYAHELISGSDSPLQQLEAAMSFFPTQVTNKPFCFIGNEGQNKHHAPYYLQRLITLEIPESIKKLEKEQLGKSYDNYHEAIKFLSKIRKLKGMDMVPLVILVFSSDIDTNQEIISLYHSPAIRPSLALEYAKLLATERLNVIHNMF